MSELGPDGQQRIRVGKLNLVDLAGSERMVRAHGSKNYKEATWGAMEGLMTNWSLTQLQRCVTELVASRKKL